MISIQWPVLVLVFLDETILGLCLLKEFAFECRWIPLINPQWTPLASWSTPSWRLHWYSVNSWLTVGGQSTFFHRHAFECRPMSHLANYQPTYNQMSIKMLIECKFSVNQVYRLALDPRCLLYTWSQFWRSFGLIDFFSFDMYFTSQGKQTM